MNRRDRDRDDYQFLEIKDALPAIGQKVNLIGVIIECGLARRSQGTDCYRVVKIIDESHPKPGLTVVIFHESFEKLPRVASLGDIIQLHRVLMKSFDGDLQANFNKKFSSFALYEGKDGQNFLPYHASSTFRPRDLDKKFISSLRDWLVGFELDEGSTSFSSMGEIKEGEIDLICKVVYKCEDAEDGFMACVWDGTDAQPVSIDSKLENEIVNAPQFGSLPLPRDILCTLPSVGSILKLIFKEGIEQRFLIMLNTGNWVKFVKVLCKVQVGLPQIVVTEFSKLRYTTNEECLILGRQRFCEERSLSKWGRIPAGFNPSPSLVTAIEVDHNDVRFVTLMDVLTYPEVTAKYICVVRLIAVYPSEAKDFCSPKGNYRVRLSLEDPTARIHAFLYAEDGDKFFGGNSSIDALTRKRNQLLGVSEAEGNDGIRNPPWFQCCLKSYYLSKSDKWGSRQYRIFDTEIISD